MSKTIKRAATSKDRAKKRLHESDSEDSDDVNEDLEAEAELKELKKLGRRERNLKKQNLSRCLSKEN